MKDLAIEMVPPSRLAPYARNARTHSPEQVAQIAASIVEFGFTNPILVDREFGIIAGHGRLMAAQRLELSAVPVVMLEHLSDAQRRALIIADNKIAENAGWDEALLKQEFAGESHEPHRPDLARNHDAVRPDRPGGCRKQRAGVQRQHRLRGHAQQCLA